MYYINLHNHSQYSLLDALATPAQIVDTAAKLNQDAVALTDHAVMSGIPELYREAKKQGIKPIIGQEFYLTNDTRIKNKKDKRFHLCIFAKDWVGYKILVKLSSFAHKRENFYFKPLLDKRVLERLRGNKHIIVSSACISGEINWAALMSEPEVAYSIAQYYRDLFPNFFLEFQNHGTKEDKKINKILVQIASKLSVPVIFTSDSHYLKAEDKELHDTFLAIHKKDPFSGSGYHLLTAQEAESQTLPMALDFSSGFKELVNMADVRIKELEEYKYFVPSLPHKKTLREMCSEKIPGNVSREYLDRVDAELDVIEHCKFEDVIFLVADYCQWAKNKGIVINARGSVNSSLVCFLMGITNIDPIRWRLKFERFLSKDRIKPPDIDMDVENEKRQELLDYIAQKAEVCGIGTHLTFDERSAINAFREKLNIPDTVFSLEELKEEMPSAYPLVKNIHGVRKSAGAHAAGVVIESQEQQIKDFVPTRLIASSNKTVTQYDQDILEDMGFIKLDILGHRNLHTIKRCCEMIGKNVDLKWIPLDDKKTFKMPSSGKTVGVFTYDGWTARRGCKELKPQSVNDCIVIQALYRPAPLQEGFNTVYCERKKGKDAPTYKHPILHEVFDETYGIPLFQEQVIELLQKIGMDIITINYFLSAMKQLQGKKKKVGKHKDEFLKCCKEHKLNNNDIRFAWSVCKAFVQYGFNKAHATSYGLLGYYTAYLKANYPLEYMAALLETAGEGEMDKYHKGGKNLVEALRLGCNVLPVDLNYSKVQWSLDMQHQAIRAGFTSLFGIGVKVAQELQAHQPYKNKEDLLLKTSSRIINVKVIKILEEEGLL